MVVQSWEVLVSKAAKKGPHTWARCGGRLNIGWNYVHLQKITCAAAHSVHYL